MFQGSDGLKAGVANSFNTPFDCLRSVGGLSKSLISDMAAATNRYFHQKIRPKLMGRRGYFHSQKWKDVTIQEMTRFLGIILMMSLRPLDSGGYASYFNASNRMYSLGTAIPSVEILDSTGWASKYMRLARFRQIRGAFHPESKGAARWGGGTNATSCVNLYRQSMQLRRGLLSFLKIFRLMKVELVVGLDTVQCISTTRTNLPNSELISLFWRRLQVTPFYTWMCIKAKMPQTPTSGMKHAAFLLR